ncbi:MAG: PA14 domain-containing protein [Phycisphaerae bacterium]|nr:PA14 domain-containing protein [Phycisphaerae bacterium]
MGRKLIYLGSFVFLLGLAHTASAEIPRDPNLVIYYSYDKVGAIVPDESGKGHNGTVCGDVSAAPSGIKWYGAAEFQGIWGPTGYSYLDLDSPHYPAVDIPKTAITLAAWAKCRKTGQEHAIISCRASDNTWVIHPQINNDGTFRWLLRAKGSVQIFNLNGVGKHGWDEWLHYAGTYDSVTGKGILYINGEVCASTNVPPGQYIADWGTGARVGYNIDNARPFTGVMDELYLFTRALSQVEVNDLLAAEGLPSEKATHPNPANGAELDATATVLEWLPGVYAASNDVYFGTSFEDVNNGTGGTFKGNQTEAKFAATDLVWGTTYYWRIDGVNTVEPNSPWKGDVWSFLLRPTTAWNPTPADGAQWIDPNANLSWSAGRGATKHLVYFGDNFDTVKNATGAAPQTTTTYDSGLLGYEKVYYWRVDELDDAGTTHKGTVWSFTTRRADSGLKGEYYKDMELKTLVLTRVDPGINFNWGAAAPVSGVPADNFSVRWTGELEVPFTSEWTFTANCDDCVRLWVNGQLLFDEWGQQSGVEWIGLINLAQGQKYSIVMEYYENTGDARAILYWSTPSWLSPYQPKQVIPQGAFSLPVRARGPEPAHGAVDVPQTSILRWTAGEKAASHDVYFGADANAVTNATTTTAGIYRGRQPVDTVTFDPGTLAWNKTYYWRIDEVNEASAGSPWKGSVWSFTTADFLVVDDMESYNDDDHCIYDTWLDNFGDDSGSVVGNNPAPFAEQVIVHGGTQSMPLSFNNAGPKHFFSETVRTFASVQDWTVNGIGTLELYVQGVATNGAGRVYVVVEDSAGKSAVVTNTDSTVVTKTTWTEWKVPLSSFTGVNAAKIKKLYIGVGDRKATTAGGGGRIYVDDIRVVKP